MGNLRNGPLMATTIVYELVLNVLKSFCCLSLLAACAPMAVAQTTTLTGIVLDAGQLKPLPFATVYLDRTTIGTTTNERGEFTLPAVPVGTQQVVISFIGFVTQVVPVRVADRSNGPVRVLLQPDAHQVAEVTVKTGRDKVWEKQRRRFEKAFLGNTTTCRLLNPWVVNFTEDGTRLMASSAVPLAIENKGLGYRLSFNLKQFTTSPTEFAIVGTIQFTELDVPDTLTAHRWLASRKRAYLGSVRHLITALLHDPSDPSGFALYREKQPGKPRSDKFDFERQTNLVPIGKSLAVGQLPGTTLYRIPLDGRLEVHYTDGFAPVSFYKDTNYPVSWLESRRGMLLADSTGNLLNPTDVVVSGSMADERVSAMLPLDYKPGGPVRPPSGVARRMARLRETVYLHTDRPYYRPGETLWFSAYMRYSVPTLRDSLSRVLYADLIAADGTIVRHQTLPIDEGRTAGQFRLPGQSGNYVLRVYTQWMRNYGTDSFFYQPIALLPPDKRVRNTAPPAAIQPDVAPPGADSLLALSVDKPAYKKRSRVGLTLQLISANGPMSGSFSVAVYDQTNTVSANPVSGKISSVVDEPVPQEPAPFRYAVEKGLTLNGVYTNRKGNGTKTKLTLIPQTLGAVYQVITQSDGSFSISGLDFVDSTTFVVQPSGGRIRWLVSESPTLPARLPVLPLTLMASTDQYASDPSDTVATTTLNQVDVVAKKKVQSENSYAQADVLLKSDALNGYASVAEAVVAKLPGFKLVFDQNSWYLIWARAATGIPNSTNTPHEPNLYIDNVQVLGIPVGERLMQLNPTLIDHIELNGMITANQGANGSNGLINVYTKRLAQTPSAALSTVTATGFDRTVSFSSPDYSVPLPATDAPAYRPTVYWNPRLTLDSAHPATLYFSTSDQPGPYRVVVNGLTNDGMGIHSEAVFVVKE